MDGPDMVGDVNNRVGEPAMRFPEEIWVIITDLKRHKPFRAELDALLARAEMSTFRLNRSVYTSEFRSGDHIWTARYITPNHLFAAEYFWRKASKCVVDSRSTRVFNAEKTFWEWFLM